MRSYRPMNKPNFGIPLNIWGDFAAKFSVNYPLTGNGVIGLNSSFNQTDVSDSFW